MKISRFNEMAEAIEKNLRELDSRINMLEDFVKTIPHKRDANSELPDVTLQLKPVVSNA